MVCTTARPDDPDDLVSAFREAGVLADPATAVMPLIVPAHQDRIGHLAASVPRFLEALETRARAWRELADVWIVGWMPWLMGSPLGLGEEDETAAVLFGPADQIPDCAWCPHDNGQTLPCIAALISLRAAPGEKPELGLCLVFGPVPEPAEPGTNEYEVLVFAGGTVHHQTVVTSCGIEEMFADGWAELPSGQWQACQSPSTLNVAAIGSEPLVDHLTGVPAPVR